MTEVFDRESGRAIGSLGWQGSGLDYEVSGGPRYGTPYTWCAYDEDILVATGRARTRLGLAWATWRARTRLLRESE